VAAVKSLAVATITLPKRTETSGRRSYNTAPGRQRIVLPKLPQRRSCANVYDYAAVDKCGRVVAPSALAALGWERDMPLSVSELDGLVLFKSDGEPELALDAAGVSQGSLPDPSLVRALSLALVLVVAEPRNRRLIIHPPVAIDAMVARAHQAAFGGEQA
jgi:hypothetical protein